MMRQLAALRSDLGRARVMELTEAKAAKNPAKAVKNEFLNRLLPEHKRGPFRTYRSKYLQAFDAVLEGGGNLQQCHDALAVPARHAACDSTPG